MNYTNNCKHFNVYACFSVTYYIFTALRALHNQDVFEKINRSTMSWNDEEVNGFFISFSIR